MILAKVVRGVGLDEGFRLEYFVVYWMFLKIVVISADQDFCQNVLMVVPVKASQLLDFYIWELRVVCPICYEGHRLKSSFCSLAKCLCGFLKCQAFQIKSKSTTTNSVRLKMAHFPSSSRVITYKWRHISEVLFGVVPLLWIFADSLHNAQLLVIWLNYVTVVWQSLVNFRDIEHF